ncbi:Thioredoxin [hydrothermal vent metagenome]|uniref:Thioredoxin n=1 Tax=hydrothermal vent metagenome TaxID=652676 RepID=A0A1W1C418_9ZZZZ
MTQLIFVLDPMCSWCWGFHPVIETLRKEHADHYTFSLVMGGLRTTGQMEWNAQSKAYLASAWDSVAKTTKQPFNPSLLNKTHFDYNTYPACKAVITVRELYGEDAAFAYLGDIQKAFYVDGADITTLETLTHYVTQDKEAFQTFYQSDRAELLMQHDFSKARSMGANTFPSVVKIDEDGHMVCINGYKYLEDILKI